MLRILFIALILISACPEVYAQMPQQWEKHGDKSWEENDFYGAAYYYRLGYAQDSSNLALGFKLSEALRKYNNYAEGELAYEAVFARDEASDYPLALFWYAYMLKHNEKYELARKHFDMYSRLYKSHSGRYTKWALQEVKSCEWAMQNAGNDTLIDVRNENTVNSYDAEFSPFLDFDSTLYWAVLHYDTSGERKLDKAKRSYYVQNVRMDSIERVHPEDFNESGKNSANWVATPDGNRAYYTVCEGTECKIYYRERLSSKDHWSPQEEVKAATVSGFIATHPWPVRMDGQEILFFASNRPRGKGGMDIWYCEILDKGKFGRAKNLGDAVNTQEDELTPFYDTLEQKFYFSSNWHYGFGGFDVFEAEGSPQNPTGIKNVGKTINSSANDLYFKKFNAFKQGYLISNREGSLAAKGETCCNDIYTFSWERDSVHPEPEADTPKVEEPPVLISEVPKTELETAPEPQEDFEVFAALTPIQLYFDNDMPNPRSTATSTRTNYLETWKSYAQAIKNYEAYYSDTAKLYRFVNDNMRKSESQLLAISDTLLSLLEKGYIVTIALKGYTSPLAATAYNENLAKRRIASVKNSFLAHKNGVLKPFENKQLKFVSIPMGEFLSDGLLDDSRENLAQSVYSLEAMQARKVEIAWIEKRLPEDTLPALRIDQHRVNAGKLSAQSQKTISINLSNNSLTPLEIKSITSNNPDVVVEEPKSIKPNETATLKVQINASAEKGIYSAEIHIYSNALNKKEIVYLRWSVGE